MSVCVHIHVPVSTQVDEMNKHDFFFVIKIVGKLLTWKVLLYACFMKLFDYKSCRDERTRYF